MGIAAEIARDWPSCVQRFVISGVKLGNRYKETLKNSQTAALILDFRPRLANRCKETLKNNPKAASILDFRARLGNRCSVIAAASKNGPPAA